MLWTIWPPYWGDDKDPVYSGYRDIATLPQHMLQEISHFFEVYKNLEHSETSVKMIDNHEEAKRVIDASLIAYKVQFPKRPRIRKS